MATNTLNCNHLTARGLKGLEKILKQSLRSGVFRCTANDLKMVSRLIKHDLRINAGARQMYASLVDSSALGICCPMQALGAGG